MKKIAIISVGGSLIVPDKIDVNFLKKFRNLILKYVRKGWKFVIISGGGKTCRNYQKAARSIVNLSKHDIDWIGIQSTVLNAHFMRSIFYSKADPIIIHDPTKNAKFRKNILISSGWKPGFSTDYDSVMIAKNFHAKSIVNLSNIDYVYNRDPKKFRNAKPIKRTGWREFRRLLPKKWSPGMNVPFDPVASRLAQRLKLEVVIMNGNNLSNLKNYLDGKKFIGTLIR